MNYNCHLCSRSFRRKDYLVKHLKRKKTCINIDIQTQNTPLDTTEIRNTQIYPYLSKFIQIYPNLSKNIDNVKNVPVNPKNRYKCKFCNKIYKFQSGISKHINNLRCPHIPQNIKKNIIFSKKNKEILEKVKKNDNLKSLDIISSDNLTISHNSNNSNITNNTINNNSNNSINSNNVINININPFGNENYNSITKKQKIGMLNKMFMALPAMLKELHFDIPENCNFFLANKREKKYITYYNGEQLIYEHSHKFKDTLCTNLMEHLEEWFHEYKDKLLKNKKTTMKKMFDQYYSGELDDKYFEEVDKYLLSYSDNIKTILNETIKQVKMQDIKKLQDEIEQLNL